MQSAVPHLQSLRLLLSSFCSQQALQHSKMTLSHGGFECAGDAGKGFGDVLARLQAPCSQALQ